MTIEEKAQRYDEAKLRMSAAYNSNRCTIGFMNEIFPELRESGKENKDKYLYNTGEKGEYIPTCSGRIIEEFRKYMKGE